MGSVGTELASRGAPDPQEAGWGLSWPPGAPLPPRSWVGTDDQPTCSDRCLGPPNPLTSTELAGSASRCRDPVLGCMSPRSYPTLAVQPSHCPQIQGTQHCRCWQAQLLIGQGYSKHQDTEWGRCGSHGPTGRPHHAALRRSCRLGELQPFQQQAAPPTSQGRSPSNASFPLPSLLS